MNDVPMPDLAGCLRGLDEIEAKWVAVEDQLRAELRETSRWRFWRRAMIQARLDGINEGLLKLSFERLDVQFRAARAKRS